MYSKNCIRRRNGMIKFNGRRTLEEIKKEAELRGLWVDESDYDKGGDFVRIGWVGEKTGFGFMAFYPLDGRFYLYDEDNKSVCTYLDDEYDEEEWYKEVLYFIYGEENEIKE